MGAEPRIDLPDWNLFGWVPDLFGWVPTRFAWVPGWDLGWLKFVIGILVAMSLAAEEIERRTRLRRRAEASDED